MLAKLSSQYGDTDAIKIIDTKESRIFFRGTDAPRHSAKVLNLTTTTGQA